MDVDEVADELYAVVPEEFVAVRTARQAEARADGDRALAKEIGALPKPSAAAWVCNLLVRRQREEIEGLVELGGLLREAQENLAGDQLRALNTQRSQLLGALTRQAAALARELGHPVSSAVATQVEETLRAAMTDPDAGAALLSGRLTAPMSYTGLGTVVARPDLRLVRTPPPASPRERRGDPERARRDREEEARRAAEEKRRRELAEARAAAEEAAATATEAEEAAADARTRAEELTARHDALRRRVEELREALAEAEEEAADAATGRERAERRRRTAEREAADAAAARDRALDRVAALAGED